MSCCRSTPPRAAEADHQRRGGQRDRQHRGHTRHCLDPVDHRVGAVDAQRIDGALDRGVGHLARPQGRCRGDADHRGDGEPDDGAPAWSQQAAVREEQEQQRRQSEQRGQEQPDVEPRGDLATRQRAAGAERVGRVREARAGERERHADRAEQPADEVVGPSRGDDEADGWIREQPEGEDEVERGAALSAFRAATSQQHQHDRGKREPDGDAPEDPRQPSPHRSHTETWAGWTVSATTPRRSAVSASRSTSSRSRVPNSSSVRAAS